MNKTILEKLEQSFRILTRLTDFHQTALYQYVISVIKLYNIYVWKLHIKFGTSALFGPVPGQS